MLVLGAAGYLVIPNVLNQAASFIQSLPERLMATRVEIAQLDQPIFRKVLPELGLVDQIATAVRVPPVASQEDRVTVGAAAARTVISVLNVFVPAFYWLVERARIKRVLLRACPLLAQEISTPYGWR